MNTKEADQLQEGPTPLGQGEGMGIRLQIATSIAAALIRAQPKGLRGASADVLAWHAVLIAQRLIDQDNNPDPKVKGLMK